MTDAHYQLSGMTFPAENVDPFGMWNVIRMPAAVSYALDQPPPPEEPIHRVQFPSLEDGIRDLQAKQVALIGQDRELDDLEHRLTQLAASQTGVSFAVAEPPPPEFVQPERQLQAALLRLQMPSFAAEQAQADLEATSQWRQLLDQIRETISHYAHVETEVGGSPIGRTTVGWTGDFRTIWAPAVTAASMDIHQRNVSVTLRWRLGTLKFVGVVGAGAANVAVKLGIPGGQLLALPAVWNFVKDVLQEWRKLQAIKSQ